MLTTVVDPETPAVPMLTVLVVPLVVAPVPILTVEAPVAVPMHGLVPRLSGTPGVLARPAPRIGEHNDEILTPVLGAAEVARLRAASVLRDPVVKKAAE